MSKGRELKSHSYKIYENHFKDKEQELLTMHKIKQYTSQGMFGNKVVELLIEGLENEGKESYKFYKELFNKYGEDELLNRLKNIDNNSNLDSKIDSNLSDKLSDEIADKLFEKMKRENLFISTSTQVKVEETDEEREEKERKEREKNKASLKGMFD